MLTIQTVCLLAPLTVVVLLSGRCSAHPRLRQRHETRPLCEGCGDECDKCEYGVAMSSICGVPECRRGPGEICGGPSESWGVCGDGLTCRCNRCTGCSLDSLACYQIICLPHQSLQSRHLDLLEKLPIAK